MQIKKSSCKCFSNNHSSLYTILSKSELEIQQIFVVYFCIFQKRDNIAPTFSLQPRLFGQRTKAWFPETGCSLNSDLPMLSLPTYIFQIFFLFHSHVFVEYFFSILIYPDLSCQQDSHPFYLLGFFFHSCCLNSNRVGVTVSCVVFFEIFILEKYSIASESVCFDL